MKSCPFMLILFTMFTTLAVGQEHQKVTLKGVIKDLKSKMPLAAQIKIIYKDSKLGIHDANAKADGSFEIMTLPKQFVLQAKTDGYIVSNIMMNLENLSGSTVISEISLIFNGKSKINQLLLEFSAKKKEQEQNNGIPKNKQVFQAVDALNNKAISAQFRLMGVYKNTTINKATTKEESVFEHNYTDREHLLVEVTAEGYQKFLSEIDIEVFDETVHENTAKLIRHISFLNLIIKNEPELQNINVFEVNNGGTQKQIGLAKTDGIHFGMLTTGNKYKVTINTKIAEEITKEFVAVEGLNQVVIALEPKPKKQTSLGGVNNVIAIETKVVQVEKQAYQPEKKAISLESQTLFFEQSSYILKPESKVLLEEISKRMVDSPDVSVEITGHTDNIGDTRQNLYLSEFRAKVISNYLFNKGIKDNRIKLKGDGSKVPSTGNDTEDSRQRNRRAELRFY